MIDSITRHLLIGLACLSVLVPTTLHAEDWKFKLTPYIWATSLKGTAGIGPVSGDIDLDFDEILDDLEMALMLNLRAEKGLWAIQADGVWADLKSDETSGPLRTTVDTEMWIIELNGRYRFADNWEVLAGARYFRQDLGINLSAGGPGVNVGDTADWIDPVIGAAFATSLSDKWSFQLMGDIGGFGVGSQFTWQAWADFDWRFSKLASLALGYRHLDWDYKEGSGATRFSYDAYLTGPTVGVTFNF